MILSLVLLLFISAIFIYLWKWIRMQHSLPPGPQPLPLIGNFHQVDIKDPRNTMVEWNKKYGPIFTIWMGAEPFIFVTGYDMMKEIFVTQGSLSSDRYPNFLFETFTNGKFGILNSSGERWSEQRRFALHTLRNFGFGRTVMEEKIRIEIEKMIDEILQKFNGSKSLTFSINDDIEWCVGNIISSLVLGRSYPKGGDSPTMKIKRLIDHFGKNFNTTKVTLLNSLNWLRFVPLFSHFGFDNIQITTQQMVSIMEEEINDRKRDLDLSAEPNDFTSAYLQEINRRQKSGEGMGHFSEWQLLCVINDLISAGMETTVKTLIWGVLFMITHPKVQQKAKEEIEQVITDKRLPSLSDRSRMPYMNAVINEVQRLANILPFNFARRVKETLSVGGYKIPKGAVIVPQISAVLFDDTIFENPLEFIPERFLEGDNLSLKKCEQLIPFSLGKRSCLGESLARAELFMIFTSLVQKFHFSVPYGEPSPTLKPAVGFTFGPELFDCFVEVKH